MSKSPSLTALDATSLALKAVNDFVEITGGQIHKVHIIAPDTDYCFGALPAAKIELLAEPFTAAKYRQLQEFKNTYEQVYFTMCASRQENWVPRSNFMYTLQLQAYRVQID